MGGDLSKRGRLVSARRRRAARAIVILLAAGFLSAGICLDEPLTVMMNAIMVCLSCIGVG